MVVPRDKHQEEDAVLAALLSYLHGNDVPAILLGCPDTLAEARRSYPGLTSDALIDRHVGEETPERWSIDVMALPAPNDLGPTPAALHERFTPLAERLDVSFRFEGTMPGLDEVSELAKRVTDAVLAPMTSQASIRPEA